MKHKRKGTAGRFLSVLLAAAVALAMPADILSAAVYAKETGYDEAAGGAGAEKSVSAEENGNAVPAEESGAGEDDTVKPETEAGSTDEPESRAGSTEEPDDGEEPGEEPVSIEKKDTAECVCGTLCTADSANADCPVCGAEGAGIAGCKGEPEDTNECRICPIEDLIAALPDEVTEDNAKDVRAQLDEILSLYKELTEEEQDQIDLSRCYALQEALDAAGIPALLEGDVSASYRKAEWNGSEVVYSDETEDACTAVTDSDAEVTWDAGWYVVNSSVIIDGRITVTGAVNLILEDGCTLTASQGIRVLSGDSLTIYGQAGGTGKLTATGAAGCAGIGGVKSSGYRDSGAITICGGTVTAIGGENGAGIGGGERGEGIGITISGGMVTATGGEYGAGIGGGGISTLGGEGRNITIYGGEVMAAGGAGGAGIGGGNLGEGSSISIYGGMVTATGGEGISGDGISTLGGAGIGGGYSKKGSGITISGGEVMAAGGERGAGIGGGERGAGSDITISGGTVEASGGAGGAGIGGGYNRKGSGITISGGTVEATGGWSGAGIGGGVYGAGSSITISGGEVTASGGENGAGIGGGESGAGSGITISGGEVTASGGNNGAGIGGGVYEEGSSITINGGEVTATGGAGGAGIGGGSRGAGSNIAISGGTVEASGGKNGAGIGGGVLGGGSSITISGGEVEATGGTSGAGIGGGSSGMGSGITISGGEVEATGGFYGAGIGGGSSGTGSGITISGGEVTATGGTSGAGIGGGNSGTSTGFSTGDDGSAVIFTNSIGDTSGQDNWNGVIFQGSEGQVYGDVTLTEDFEIPSGKDLTIPDGSSLTIPDGKTLTIPAGASVKNEGVMTIVGGDLTGGGTLAGSGAFTEDLTADKIIVPTGLYYTPDLTETKLAAMVYVSVSGSKTILGQTFAVDPSAWKLSVTKVSDLKYTATYTSTRDSNKMISKNITLLQSGTEFVGSGAVKTYKGETETTAFAYSDTITIKATPTATGKAPAANRSVFAAAKLAPLMAASFDEPAAGRMAVYYKGVQVSAPSTVADGVHTMTVDTADLGLTEQELNGEITLTVKYIASTVMADAESTVKVTVNAAAKVTKSGATTYVDNLQDVFVAANRDATVTLLQGVTLTDCINVTTNITLDLNGHTIKGGDKAFSVDAGSFIIKNTGTVGGITASGSAIEVSNGILEVSDGGVLSSTGGGYGISVTGGIVNVTGKNVMIEKLSVTGGNLQVSSESAEIEELSVSGSGAAVLLRGTYKGAPAIQISDGGHALSDLLYDEGGIYCAYFSGGKPIDLTALQSPTELNGSVTVKPCTHEESVSDRQSNNDGTHTVTCRACGYSEAAAECTYGLEGTVESSMGSSTESSTDCLTHTVHLTEECTVCGYSRALGDITVTIPQLTYGETEGKKDEFKLETDIEFGFCKPTVRIDDAELTGASFEQKLAGLSAGKYVDRLELAVAYPVDAMSWDETTDYCFPIPFTIRKAAGRTITNLTGSYTDNGSVYTYTIAPVKGAVYSRDGINWTKENSFGNITPGTRTVFYAKIPEDGNYEDGVPKGIKVTFPKFSQTAPVLSYTRATDTLTGEITLTITEVEGADYSFDGGNTWTDNREQGGFNRAQTVTIAVRRKETDTHNPSPANTMTVNLAKEDRGAPPDFTLAYEANGETDYTVTIPPTEGCEYSFDGVTWSDSNVKSGVKVGEKVTGYKRYKETDVYNTGVPIWADETMPKFTVKTPVIFPAGGVYEDSLSVTITCGTQGAQIYYTTDGSTPTGSSIRYTGEFTLTVPAAVKAVAVKDGFLDSAVASETYTKKDSGLGDNGNHGDSGQENGGDNGQEPGDGNTALEIPFISPAYNTTDPGQWTGYVKPQTGNTGKTRNGADSFTMGAKQPFIKGADGKIGWDAIRTEEEKAKEGSVINVYMNGNTVVPGDIFDNIKGRDITITFDMGNGIVWSVDGKSVTAEKAGDIDFDLKTGVSAIPIDIINNVTGERYNIQISLVYEGEFGFTAVLMIDLGKENAGYTASLYYYNASTGELEFICQDEVAEDGAVQMAFTHASDYVIVIDGEPETEGGLEQAQPEGAKAADKAAGNDAALEESPETGQEKKTIWLIIAVCILALAGAGIAAATAWKKRKSVL